MQPHPLVRTVGQLLARLEGHGGMVAAVSGGPDSVALLRALLELRSAATAGPLVIAHLNHRLRGEESDRDETFVRELHAILAPSTPGLVLRCESIDVAARAAGDNLEDAARQARYAWLAQVAREHGACWVATGHTANDQAETILHRLLRGTGLRGLCGIAGRRSLGPGVEVIRPLLRVSRAEVLAYLRSLGQPYRQDRSNEDRQRTRNRIRHELLPHLAERYNPEVVSVLCRLAQQADEVFGREEAEARALLARAERPRAGPALVLDRACLANAPRGLVREALRLAWGREGWPMGRMDFDAWDRLAAVALGEVPASDFPEGIRARRRERVVLLGRLS